jgi:C4-dicarboxylate-specific signal transduction histidine kinase
LKHFNHTTLKQSMLLLLMSAVFVADTVTALEIAIAVFYVVPILVAVSQMNRKGVTAVVLLAMLLTVISFPLSAAGEADSGLINLLISLCAIGSTGWLALCVDAANRVMQSARSQAAHMGRVTALGELSASIAHEVNQPLAAIITSTDACKRWLGAQPPNYARAIQTVERIGADAHRASEIIQRVRRLASPSPPVETICDIGEQMMETIALLRPQLNASRVDIRYELPSEPLRVRADPVQLQQVFLNLLVNAIEALLETREHERHIFVRGCPLEREVHIAIEDNGIGLEVGAENHLFDPFFTTKKSGMGIGLAISRSIVESSGGSIRAERNTCRGATFHVHLPSAN